MLKSIKKFTHPHSDRFLRKLVLLAFGSMLLAVLLIGFLLLYGTVPNRWYQVLAVSSGSMSPTIDAGDLIVITRPLAVLEPGMIVTMRVSGEIVTHRLIQMNPDGSFLSRGDANAVNDDWDGQKIDILGQDRFRLPGMGTLLQKITAGKFTNQTYGWFKDVDQIGFSLSIVENPDLLLQTPEPSITPTPSATALFTPTQPALWDESRLVFDLQGYNCTGEGLVWAVVKNVGKSMAGTSTWELYQDQVLPVASGELSPLAGDAFQTLEVSIPANGTYFFRVFQRPGFPEDAALWSQGIVFDRRGCSTPPDIVIPPTATSMPTILESVEPQPTSIVETPVPAETALPTDLPAATGTTEPPVVDTAVPEDTPPSLPTPDPTEAAPPAEETPTA